MLEVEMGVDLRGRDARMPEHFLHRAQVPGRLEQVRGEGMTQHMRVDMLRQAEAQRPLGKSVTNRAGGYASAPRAHEKGRFPWLCKPGALGEPGRDRGAGFASDRHGARLRALARHGDLRLPQHALAVRGIEAHQLRKPQSRGVEQLEHGLVTRLRQSLRRGLQQPRHEIGGERLGQRLRAFRRAQADTGVVGKGAVLDEPMEETAPAREQGRNGPARNAARVQQRDSAA